MKYQILIVGGGNAGLSTAAKLLRKNPKLQIGIIEPSDKHYYQPAWTLVGGGSYDITDTVRNEADFIPKGAEWIKDAVATFQPEQNTVTTRDGKTIGYEYLVVCPGIQLNWSQVEGLPETLGKNGVCSNYSFQYAPYTFECLQNLKEGTAIFTAPSGAVKCGGAPQKIMYLAADYFRRAGLAGKVKVEFWTAGGVIFGIEKYAKTLRKVVERYGINTHFKHDLIRVNGPAHKATFKVTAPDGSVSEETVHFDMLHVTPPQSAPDFISSSPLANAAGWVDVDKYTLQHNKYPNIFSLGDAAGLPNSRTGAAVRKEAPVLVKNLLAVMAGQMPTAKYSGYSSCPIVTGYGKLMLAEFDYDNKPTETFPFDQSKERWTMWILKRYILPWLYWNKILNGAM
ncbi:MAG: NAD(P)/FAD-dependent oxidoreductase [Haliscomenobacteraceae bacterium CHB4]|nr:Sulfide dehydrogenase [flavocytochrome c] flavoprotein chain [Saprospiraceae bacterium]MCE7925170.1 NAD(P)/FAD-dependent oxidoreductase [Haliscomenobacteraceae bacterium CHB4]